MNLAATDRLTFAKGRELLELLDARRDAEGVLRRSAFEPHELRPWFGGIAIMQWSSELSDYRYRLFGTLLAQNIGRDLTGLTLAEWPAAVAQIMREQADVARSRRTIVVSHYRLRVLQRNGVMEDGVRTQEKLVMPMAYPETGGPDAVLVYVDQRFADIPILRAHMDATAGSCWCAADRSPTPGCPMPATVDVTPTT